MLIVSCQASPRLYGTPQHKLSQCTNFVRLSKLCTHSEEIISSNAIHKRMFEKSKCFDPMFRHSVVKLERRNLDVLLFYIKMRDNMTQSRSVSPRAY